LIIYFFAMITYANNLCTIWKNGDPKDMKVFYLFVGI